MRDHLLQQLDELAQTDVLTGLPNRRPWELELDRGLSRARRTGDALSVAMIDIEFAIVLPACPEGEGPRPSPASPPHESAVRA